MSSQHISLLGKQRPGVLDNGVGRWDALRSREKNVVSIVLIKSLVHVSQRPVPLFRTPGRCSLIREISRDDIVAQLILFDGAGIRASCTTVLGR